MTAHCSSLLPWIFSSNLPSDGVAQVCSLNGGGTIAPLFDSTTVEYATYDLLGKGKIGIIGPYVMIAQEWRVVEIP